MLINNIGHDGNGVTYGNAAEVILMELQSHITVNEINNLIKNTKSLQNILNNELDKFKSGDSQLIENFLGPIIKNRK